MTWTLNTTNTTRDFDLSDINGLRLFSTDLPINSTLNVVDPLAPYSLETVPEFEPVLDLETPTPSESILYVINTVVDVTSFTQVFNINLLELESYYIDYVESKTYILSSATGLIITGETELSYDSFSELNFIYTYDFGSPQSFTVDSVNVNGLIFSGANLTFDGQILTITASRSCGPQEGDTFTLSLSYTETAADTTHDVYIFDFSTEDIDVVDSLSWENQQYQLTSEVLANTLLYNRVQKLAIGIRN